MIRPPTTPETAAFLRSERESRGWSRREMARRLRHAAMRAGDNSVPGLDSMMHNIYRWERAKDGISERYWLLYASAFSTEPAPVATSTLTITITLPPGAQVTVTP